ncbi:HD domain-containing protein [Candidatus Dojkabacteria bacterium]|jgi:hypothetical protein|nr:HD domain-containing protein [Candidatus Dojkabacteria bacterium]
MKYTFDELWNRLPETIRIAMSKCEQDPVWHPEGPADTHTKLVFEYANNHYDDVDLLIAAIFHDLGKPETQRIQKINDKVKISNIGHETKCEFYINKFFQIFSDITTNKEKILEICNNHMKAHLYLSNKLKKSSKRKSFESLTYFDDIIKFSICDDCGR